MSEAEFDQWLRAYVITPVGWLVIVFAVAYFGWKLIAWLWIQPWAASAAVYLQQLVLSVSYVAPDEIMSRTPDPAYRSEPPANPQSYALDRPAELSQTVPEPALVPGTEPEWIEVTREELIESLALVLVLEPDGTKRKLSQDMISKSAAMSKEATAALMRKARGEEPPPPKPDPNMPQFEQVKHQQFVRTNAKPLR